VPDIPPRPCERNRPRCCWSIWGAGSQRFRYPRQSGGPAAVDVWPLPESV